MSSVPDRSAEPVKRAFLTACAWDVAVRKPGNVSLASPGHRMHAQMFLDSAEACVEALTRRGATVGERIEVATAATWARVGCNTNLGIVLLCAPTALAFEQLMAPHADHGREARLGVAAWRSAWERVMQGLTRDDAACAFRAIAQAMPGGLGQAPDQDVRSAPSVDLRSAMGLAAHRDRIAAQYRDAGAELFDVGLAALNDTPAAVQAGLTQGPRPGRIDEGAHLAVQRVYLAYLASAPDSHIVRRHGSALAQTVMAQARPWALRAADGVALSSDPGFIAWDEALKFQGINPGTSADLTVATLMLGALAT